MMRCPVARILGWTGLPALLFFEATIKGTVAPPSELRSVVSLSVRPCNLSAPNVEFKVSSKFCTLYEFSIALESGVLSVSSRWLSPCSAIDRSTADVAGVLDSRRPLEMSCSISRSDLRKKVVGLEETAEVEDEVGPLAGEEGGSLPLIACALSFVLILKDARVEIFHSYKTRSLKGLLGVR